MTKAQEIPWRRIAVEAAAIVVSILLAFGIDAWWDEIQRSSDERDSGELMANDLIREARARRDNPVGPVGALVALASTASRGLRTIARDVPVL